LLDSRPAGVKKEPQSHHNNRAEEDRASIDLVDIVCPVCDVATYDLDALLKHMEREHAADMFGCRLCPGRVGGWSLELIHKHVVEAHPQHDPKLLGLTTVLKRFVNVPSRLGRINCRLCPPPYQLGGPGVWLCRDGLVLVGTTGGGSVDVVENHFIQVHGITDQNQMNSKLELACRGCSKTFSSGQQKMWLNHTKSDHVRERTWERGKGVRCDYCGESVPQTEKAWHMEQEHAREVFLCRICTAADTACFPFADSLKEMMQHMVMKHGDQYDSFYEHMTYPERLYRTACTGPDCVNNGKLLAPTEDRIKKHNLEVHRGSQQKFSSDADSSADTLPATTCPPGVNYFCRCCDKANQVFQSEETVDEHIKKRHKQIIKWKDANGNN